MIIKTSNYDNQAAVVVTKQVDNESHMVKTEYAEMYRRDRRRLFIKIR